MKPDVKIIDDSGERTKTRRVVLVGKYGPGLAKITVVASICELPIVDTVGHTVGEEHAAFAV